MQICLHQISDLKLHKCRMQDLTLLRLTPQVHSLLYATWKSFQAPGNVNVIEVRMFCDSSWSSKVTKKMVLKYPDNSLSKLMWLTV